MCRKKSKPKDSKPIVGRNNIIYKGVSIGYHNSRAGTEKRSVGFGYHRTSKKECVRQVAAIQTARVCEGVVRVCLVDYKGMSLTRPAAW